MAGGCKVCIRSLESTWEPRPRRFQVPGKVLEGPEGPDALKLGCREVLETLEPWGCLAGPAVRP